MLFNKDTRLLVVAPHADDAELGCGGTINHLISLGAQVEVLLMTFAMKPYRKINPDTGEYTLYSGTDRLNEFKNSIHTLGLKDEDVSKGFWDYDDNIQYHHKLDSVPLCNLISKIEERVSEFKPTVIAVTYPSYDQDHQACAKAVDAVKRPQFYSGSVIQYEVGGESDFQPNLYQKLTDRELSAKVYALSNYKTQMIGKYYCIQPDCIEFRAHLRGREVYSEYAEAFKGIRIVNND